MRILAYIGFVLMFFSCEESIDVSEDSIIVTPAKTKEEIRLERRREIELKDSIQFSIHEKSLKEDLDYVNRNQYLDTLFFEYERTIDSVFNVKSQIIKGEIITDKHRYVMIRRLSQRGFLLNIFLLNGKDLIQVCEHEEGIHTYTNDTLEDINGDGFKDVRIDWYGSSGCCLKAFSDIYLYNPENGSFSEKFNFVNPTFSPKEKVIRGVCYGHPGNTEMYKYKWNTHKLDTIEYVYYEKDDEGEKTGRVVVSRKWPHSENNKNLKVLKKVPKEYKTIMGYDWFSDNL